jgi:hypothetical protein
MLLFVVVIIRIVVIQIFIVIVILVVVVLLIIVLKHTSPRANPSRLVCGIRCGTDYRQLSFLTDGHPIVNEARHARQQMMIDCLSDGRGFVLQ